MKENGKMMLHSKSGNLKRSRTFVSDWLPRVIVPSSVNQNYGSDFSNTDTQHSDEVFNQPRAPGPSCKALKHAVSGLSRLDDFICERLGEGFFAEVYKVTHRSTGVVQVLKMNKIQDNRPNVLRELQLMNRLSHKNILRFKGVCVHEGQLHALTEYINGGDLEQLLANNSVELPWTVRVNIAQDIASGMAYLHSRGIMHRDLTSKNVLIRKELDGSYTAVVGDFGLSAKIPDPLNKKQLSPVGSPFWMAPEVILGHNYNELADVFSYGVICCEITARVSSDPDVLPRTNNFGIDYKAFSGLITYCPLDFLRHVFRCCQVDASKRPRFTETESCMQQILENLKKDNVKQFGKERRSSLDCYTYKRSQSEENLLQVKANGVEFMDIADNECSEVGVTPVLIGEAMSRNDPFYQPSISNPFADLADFSKGGKILGKSFGNVDSLLFELPSPSLLDTLPCTPNLTALFPPRKNSSSPKKCQSLPSSPVLLRKAAERLHQESIHGSVNRKSINPKRYSFSAYGTRSKSVFSPEALADKLQFEYCDTGSPHLSKLQQSCVEREYNNANTNSQQQKYSALETSLNKGAENGDKFLFNDNVCSDRGCIDEEGDHCVNSTNSVYPGLSYVLDIDKKEKYYLGSNDFVSPVDSKTSFDDSMNSVSSLSDTERFTDPWNVRQETLTNMAIIEESHSAPAIMETSV